MASVRNDTGIVHAFLFHIFLFYIKTVRIICVRAVHQYLFVLVFYNVTLFWIRDEKLGIAFFL